MRTIFKYGGDIMQKKFKFLNKNILLISIALTIVLIIPILMQKFIEYRIILSDNTSGIDLSNKHAEQFISFLGNYISAIIGGFFTFIALHITIKQSNSTFKESRRLEQLPYLLIKEIKNPLTFPFEDCLIVRDVGFSTKEQNIYKSERNFDICIQNIGLGAICNMSITYQFLSSEDRVVGIKKPDEPYILPIDDVIALKVKYRYNEHLSNIQKIKLIIKYSDLLHNNYEQIVYIIYREGKTLVITINKPILL